MSARKEAIQSQNVTKKEQLAMPGQAARLDLHLTLVLHACLNITRLGLSMCDYKK